VQDPARELRLVVGRVALLLAFVYVLALVAALIGLAKGDGIPVLGYAFLLLPAAAFVVSSHDAIKLHRASDVNRQKFLVKRCALYAGLGLVILISAAVAIDGMNN
jgi:hypothetical protein